MTIDKTLDDGAAAVADSHSGSFARFETFVNFFSDLFSQPDFLSDADCRDSYREYVRHYYRDIFGPGKRADSAKHLKWYRRLRPLFEMPRGSTILDYGGGYGMDSIFLAFLGYQIVFYEITPHHIGIARWFAERFGRRFGTLPMRFVLVGSDPEPHGIDAVMADEVAHHIEPASRLFAQSAAMLRTGGHLFLLEPNFFNPRVQVFFFRVRGFQLTKWLTDSTTGQRYLWGNEHIRPIRVWNRLARAAGFHLRATTYIVPWPGAAVAVADAQQSRLAERLPIVRELLASHLTIEYVKG